MSDHNQADKHRRPDDDQVARLLSLAGERPPIPADLEARVYAKVERQWRIASTGRQAMRWALPASLAAAALIAIAVVNNLRNAPPVPLGTVVRITGDKPADGAFIALGDIVHAGQTIRTGTGQAIGILLAHGPSVRIAESTAVHLVGKHRVNLEGGAIYIDSELPAQDGAAITVDTKLGSVTELGTQFAVQTGDDRIGVAVREGSVGVASDQASYSVAAGEQMTIRQNGETETSYVSANDEYWHWAIELAPDYDIEGKSLLDFLEWAARETGRELQLSSDEVRRLAAATVLHGSVSGFTPIEAIESVLATTAFAYRLDDDRLFIGK